MKTSQAVLLLSSALALLSFPAACSNDGGPVEDGDGDADVGSGGTSTGDGDGDGDIGDGDLGDGDGLGGQNNGTCTAVDGACESGGECCSGQCNPNNNTCARVLGACAEGGDPCGDASECCSLSCLDGQCSVDACVQDNESCSENAECCGGKCDGDTCAPINAPAGATCKTSGNGCEDNGDCCSGLCGDGGLCEIGSSYCVQTSDVWIQDSQCCQGTCLIADGDSAGYCGVQQTGGTRCSSRKIAGEVCGGDCAECCSRTCAPFGARGVFICQPPTGCRTDGELCRDSNDCCVRNPDSTVPGAGEAQCVRVNEDDEVGRCKVGACNPDGAICGSPDDGTAA